MMESMWKQSGRSARGAGLVLLLLTLVTGPAAAQVPQDMTFSGRLVDGGGNPLVGPVLFDARIWNSAAGGTLLFAERHNGVPLDAEGNFSVLLGTGAVQSPFATFDADLFSDADRYVEVILLAPISATLTPRVPLASVPWALVAQDIVPDPNAPRFEDCGDGTVADHQTGLQWEKKTGTVGSAVDCGVVACPDPHAVNNIYPWSLAGTDPDGAAFTDFLARLNGDPTVVAATPGEARGDPALDPTVCFARHCDWHLPAIGELRTILIGGEAAPGQAPTCSAGPCIDPDFAALGGPTFSSFYWSASTGAGNLLDAWGTFLSTGAVFASGKTNAAFVRAVRAGACNRA